MRKDDIQYHGIGYGGEMVPAVNVKVNLPWSEDGWVKAMAAGECGDMPLSFLIKQVERDDSWELFGFACESEWEYLQGWAEEIWEGYPVRVEAEGRSGGWAVVRGLPDAESWDAIMVGKWAKFAKVARAIADDIPTQMATLVAFNRWEWEKAQKWDATVAAARKVFGLHLPRYAA